MALFSPNTFQALKILLMIATAACDQVYTERQSMEGVTQPVSTGPGSTTSGREIAFLSKQGQYLKPGRTVCAILCSHNGNCDSYFENRETRQCRLVRGVLHADTGNLEKAPGWRYYARADCDVQNGYVHDPESSLCFKYFPDRVSMTAAKNRCTQDGGRLLEIRNQRQQHVVAEYLSGVQLAENFGYKFAPIIGGRRADSNGPWLFDDGTPLTFFSWSFGHPTDDKLCLKMSARHGFYWGSALCDIVHDFLCQMP